MNPFIERTEDHFYTTWADINWHAVEGNVRRLQERIYRATMNKAWRRVKNLQKLLVRATSTKLLAIRRITQPKLLPTGFLEIEVTIETGGDHKESHFQFKALRGDCMNRFR